MIPTDSTLRVVMSDSMFDVKRLVLVLVLCEEVEVVLRPAGGTSDDETCRQGEARTGHYLMCRPLAVDQLP